MSKITCIFRYANTLSVDVALGAVISASFLSTISAVKLTVPELACLGLMVWVIYTADHLLDANRTNFSAATHRHRFHQKYFTQLFVAMFLILVAAALLLPFISKPVILWGSMLMAMVMVYFFCQHKMGFLKELFGAMLYTAGVFLPSGALLQSMPSHHALIFVLLFAVTVWINLVLFSWIGCRQDEADNSPSLALVFGHRRTRMVLYVLFMLQFVLVLYSIINYFGAYLGILILFLMNGVLFIIFFNPRWFAKDDKYRIVGDAIFLLPLFYLIMQ